MQKVCCRKRPEWKQQITGRYFELEEDQEAEHKGRVITIIIDQEIIIMDKGEEEIIKTITRTMTIMTIIMQTSKTENHEMTIQRRIDKNQETITKEMANI